MTPGREGATCAGLRTAAIGFGPALGGPALPLLLQGKVDPARRNYVTIFAEMLEHKQVGVCAVR